jgi:hypothetical protein
VICTQLAHTPVRVAWLESMNYFRFNDSIEVTTFIDDLRTYVSDMFICNFKVPHDGCAVLFRIHDSEMNAPDYETFAERLYAELNPIFSRYQFNMLTIYMNPEQMGHGKFKPMF